MVQSPRLPKGLRRHIRQEKAAIRRQFNDTPEAHEKIKLLTERFFKSLPPSGGTLKVEPKSELEVGNNKKMSPPAGRTSAKRASPAGGKNKNVKRPQSRSRKAVK